LDISSYKFHQEVWLDDVSLIVGWREEVGHIGSGVIKYLKEKLKCSLVAEIEPPGFFPMNSIPVEDDVARFPESKLFCYPEKNLLLFLSHSPNGEWYKFLNSIITVAQHYGRLKEIYTLGGMISLSTHNMPRQILGTVNMFAFKKSLTNLDIELSMDYETPEGQRPTLSSFLIWTAKQQNIPGASLWIPVPFYLADVEDSWAILKAVEIFSRKFELGLDLSDLYRSVDIQKEKIVRVCDQIPELNDYFNRLENSQGLSPDENDKLIRSIRDSLETPDDINI